MGESSRTVRIPKEAMEPLVLVSEAMTLEEENLASQEDVVPALEAEALILKEGVTPEAESLAPQGRVAPQTEGLVLRKAWPLKQRVWLPKSVAPKTEGLVPKESVAPEVVMGVSIVDHGTPTPTATVIQPSVQAPEFSIKQNRSSPLVAITQGNHRLKRALPFCFVFISNHRI